MTASELQSAMGAPNQRNTGQNGAGSDDQFVYNREDRTFYVYVRNGVVTTVQERSVTQARSAEPDPARCPTPAMIRSMEYEDSKIENRYNAGMHAQLAEARACR